MEKEAAHLRPDIGHVKVARMAKDTTKPLSPTVAAVFESFVANLQQDEACADVAESLRTALLAQNFDANSLRKAMFGEASEND